MALSGAAFQRAMIEMHGARGAAWLAQLPALIEACERRWSLTVGPPFSDLSYNYVARAVRSDGTEVVLKLGVPSDEKRAEIAALQFEIHDWPDQARIQARRLDQLSEQLGFDRQRLLAWSFAQAVLSAVWTVLDHGHGWEPTVALAERLESQG